MDIFLIIGIIVGLGAVVTGLLMKGTSVAILFSSEAMIVILVGTVATILNSVPKKEFMNIPKLFGVIFKDKKEDDIIETITQIIDIAQLTRRNGLLSIESKIQEIDSQFMKQGLEMVVDGVEQEYIRQVLEEEITSMEDRHRAGSAIFTLAGGTSPTLGVLGAVIGLIGALGNLSDTEKLGESISAAFVATIYGIFFGYVIWHPFATRLKRKSHEEVSKKQVILEGILAIQEGKNPKTIQTKLLSMLKPADRTKFSEADATTDKGE